MSADIAILRLFAPQGWYSGSKQLRYRLKYSLIMVMKMIIKRDKK